MYKREDFTYEFCQQLLEQYESKENAAREIEGSVFTMYDKPASCRTIEKFILQGLRLGIAGRQYSEEESRIENLLKRNGVPLSQIRQIKDVKIGQWGVHSKNPDGEIVTTTLDKTQITLVPNVPDFPIVQHAEPRIIQYADVPRVLKKTWQAVIVSDTQIGFLQNPETKEIEPIHDPIALRVSQSITADIAPTELHFIGDWMDWPFLSRWQQHDEFDAVNESIQAGYDELCKFISAAGPHVRKKVMIGSNHAMRPETFLLQHNRKAMRIRRAADTSVWPVFSEPYLLRFEDLGIQFSGQYPGGEHYILPNLLLTHAPPRAAEFQASVIHGHTHKLTRDVRVQHAAAGRQTYFTYDIGCLCQVGTTENKQRLLVTRVPSDRARTNWAQGMGVVNVVDGKFPIHSVDQISIINGQAIYGGQIYGFDSEN